MYNVTIIYVKIKTNDRRVVHSGANLLGYLLKLLRIAIDYLLCRSKCLLRAFKDVTQCGLASLCQRFLLLAAFNDHRVKRNGV